MRTLDRILQVNQAALATVEGNLLSAAAGCAVRSILVTSARPGEGRTTTAISLAWGLATEGRRRVALVDGCTENPGLHKPFGVEREPGFTDLVLGRVAETDVTREILTANLFLIASGARPPGPAGAGAGEPEAEAYARALEKLRDRFDYVVFDGEPVLTSSRASLLAGAFDGVVFVVECGRTKWQVLDLAREKIVRVGGNVLGVVLNKRKFYVPRLLYGRI